jgi:predicted transcriptional regulator
LQFTIRKEEDTQKLNSENKRRDQLCIIGSMLEIAIVPTLKTKIMYKANLSYTQLNYYLSFLVNTKLIVQSNLEGKEVYTTSALGLNFLQKHSELILLLKSNNDIKSIKFPIKSLVGKTNMLL